MDEQSDKIFLSGDNPINTDLDSEDKDLEEFKKIDNDNESKKLLPKSEKNLEKIELVNFFKDLENKLIEGKNKDLSFNEIYEKYYENQFITKNKIKSNIDQYCFSLGFLGIGTLFGIIHLIGVYMIKSIVNALFKLIVESIKMYLYCNIKSNCSITDKHNVFNFFKYYHDFAMTETIDFNLMLVSGVFGILLLNWKGFRISSLILCPFVVGPVIWLLNFEYSFEVENQFDYGILKILNLIFIYILLYIGVGALALISQQILVENYLKYKNKYIKKIQDQLDKFDDDDDDNEKNEKNIEKIRLDLQDIQVKNNAFSDPLIIKTKNKKQDDEDDLSGNKIDKANSMSFLNYNKKKERLLEKKEKIENNKFDYFFIICLITIFGYLGKYLLNFAIDYILNKLFEKDYEEDKKKFLIAIIILYGFILILSLFIYCLYTYYFFEHFKKGEEKRIIKIYKICGYIIYTEHRIKKSSNCKECCRSCCLSCKLGCENIQNCCNKTFCEVIKNFCCCCCECCQKISCICKCCVYNENDYEKEEEEFNYCFKEKRCCFWLNKFATNKTVTKIFPYVVLYFILHSTTVGFENHYEKIKLTNFSMKIWLPLYIITFILFFYFALSFSRFLSCFKTEENNKPDVDKK